MQVQLSQQNQNTLNFQKDANNSFSSEEAAKILLEKRLNVKIDIVAGQHLKYDLIITEGNEKYPTWTTIDVKENFRRTSTIIFLETINNGWNSDLKDDEYNIETVVKPWNVKSWWWSFSEAMDKTDYILFFDKEWSDSSAKGSRIAYLIPKQDILDNNNEENIKKWIWKVKWNKISINWSAKWRSAYIMTSLEKYKNKICFTF